MDGGKVIGFSVLIVGGLILINNIFGDASIWRLILKLWPLLLIGLGIYLIMHREGLSYQSQPSSESYRKLFGDAHYDFNKKTIGDKAYSVLLGEITIDLKDSIIEDGINTISTSTAIGDIKILLPSAIPSKISAQAIIGDLKCGAEREDGILPNMEFKDDNYEQSDNKLNINMNAVIGDLKIERV